MFEVPFGSHLYGTNGPNSDFDYKVVCVPPLSTLLLNYKVTNRKVKPDGKGQSGKMLAGEAEYEYIPAQVFFDDFFNGQTYAMEIAFAVLSDRFTLGPTFGPPAREYIKSWMAQLVEKFLTNNVQKMVGYAVAQSRLYGLKTERFTSLRSVIQTVNDYHHKNAHKLFSAQNRHTLRDCPDLVEELVKLPHVKLTEIANASGGSEMAPAIDVCGKKFPLTNRVTTVVDSLTKTLGNYGQRVQEFEGEGVDWKALSHAIRITEQVLELSKTGKLVFPRPNAGYLKSVKEGSVPLEEATAYLNARFSEVDAAVAASVLQPRTPELEKKFEDFKLGLLMDYYGISA